MSYLAWEFRKQWCRLFSIENEILRSIYSNIKYCVSVGMFLFIFMLSWAIWNDQSRVVYCSLAVHLVKAGPVLQYHTYTGGVLSTKCSHWKNFCDFYDSLWNSQGLCSWLVIFQKCVGNCTSSVMYNFYSCYCIRNFNYWDHRSDGY